MTDNSDDEAAFAEVFEQHRDSIHAFLLGKTSDPEAARDLLQETFLRLWRRFGDVAGFDDDRQRAWLFTVARNLVIDRYRSDATRQATLVTLADEAQRSDASQTDTAEQVARRDDLARLQRAIADLPDEQRVVLTMVVVAGMTSQQVGDALGLAPGTVRYQLHQARRQLARHVEG